MNPIENKQILPLLFRKKCFRKSGGGTVLLEVCIWQEQVAHIPAVQESAVDIHPARGVVAVLAAAPDRPAAVLVVPGHLAVVPDPVAVPDPAAALAGHGPAVSVAPVARAALCHLHRHRADRTAASGTADPDRPEEEAAVSDRSLLLSSFL